ncbi:MAG: hypothetical protein WA792_18285 [Pseudolabrys sp.]
MSLRSSVLIVASPRPRVGKTLLARLLVDFQIYNDREVAAFDLNARDSALAQFLPQHVTLADIVDIKGQMALFDRLVADDGVAKVVDVGHEAFESFVTVAGKIGFAEEARRRGLAPAVLFMTTPDLTSVEAYKALAVRMPQVTPVPVHNAILGNAQYRDKYPLGGPASALVQVPVLAPALRKFADQPPFSFAQAPTTAALDIPLEKHLELAHWVRRVFLELREMELRLLLADLQSSLQIQP